MKNKVEWPHYLSTFNITSNLGTFPAGHELFPAFKFAKIQFAILFIQNIIPFSLVHGLYIICHKYFVHQVCTKYL